MTTQTILPVNAEALKALSESKQEPAWLTDSRLASWNWLASWNCQAGETTHRALEHPKLW